MNATSVHKKKMVSVYLNIEIAQMNAIMDIYADCMVSDRISCLLHHTDVVFLPKRASLFLSCSREDMNHVAFNIAWHNASTTNSVVHVPVITIYGVIVIVIISGKTSVISVKGLFFRKKLYRNIDVTPNNNGIMAIFGIKRNSIIQESNIKNNRYNLALFSVINPVAIGLDLPVFIILFISTSSILRSDISLCTWLAICSKTGTTNSAIIKENEAVYESWYARAMEINTPEMLHANTGRQRQNCHMALSVESIDWQYGCREPTEEGIHVIFIINTPIGTRRARNFAIQEFPIEYFCDYEFYSVFQLQCIRSTYS